MVGCSGKTRKTKRDSAMQERSPEIPMGSCRRKLLDLAEPVAEGTGTSRFFTLKMRRKHPSCHCQSSRTRLQYVFKTHVTSCCLSPVKHFLLKHHVLNDLLGYLWRASAPLWGLASPVKQ